MIWKKIKLGLFIFMSVIAILASTILFVILFGKGKIKTDAFTDKIEKLKKELNDDKEIIDDLNYNDHNDNGTIG